MATEGLFGIVRAADDAGLEVTTRRTKLRKGDTVASLVLNPDGKSEVEGKRPKDVYDAISKGNKYVAYHNNMASDDVYRQGVGISQTCQAMEAVIHTLETDTDIKLLLKDQFYEKVMVEAREMKPHFQILNAGKSGGKQKA